MTQLKIGDKLEVVTTNHPIYPLGTVLVVTKPIGFNPDWPTLFTTDGGINKKHKRFKTNYFTQYSTKFYAYLRMR
jgi:hypothetical protein